MTWIEGSHQRNFEVSVPLDEVADFMSDPERLRHCLVDLERYEKVDDQTYRWVLGEVGAKNITFQADYTVRYERKGQEVVWKSEGEGTTRTEGRALLSEAGPEKTKVDYEETLANDLPVPKLARRVFRPIVKREVKKAVDQFLDNVIAYLNEGHHRDE